MYQLASPCMPACPPHVTSPEQLTAVSRLMRCLTKIYWYTQVLVNNGQK